MKEPIAIAIGSFCAVEVGLEPTRGG